MSIPTDVDTSARTPPLFAGFGELTLIARGRRAAVYRSRERAFASDVAIKILDVSEPSADEQRRFDRDSKAIVSLSSHPNIVKVFRIGATPDDELYIVMDYLDQGSLGERIRQHGPVPVDEAVHIARELLGALDAAHEIGLLHRDIKPDNVLLSQFSGVQLADFGIASIPRADERAADFPFLAPEVINGEAATEVSDIYSLGATLVALITAALPGESQVPGSLEASGASPELSHVIAKAMDETPAERYQSAAEFLEALSQVPDSGSQFVRAMGRRTAPASAIVPPASIEGWAVPPSGYEDERGTSRWAILALVAAVLVAAVGTAIALWPSKSHPTQAAPPAPIATTPAAQPTSTAPVPAVSTVHTKVLPVRITKLRRTVQLRSGGAGSRAVIATVSGPAQCLPVGYTLERRQGSWKYVRSGHLNGAITTLHVPKPGTYHVKIGESNTSGGFCPGAVTPGIVVRPAAPVSTPPATQVTPPATTPTSAPVQHNPPPAQHSPPPTKYTPPPISITPPPINS